MTSESPGSMKSLPSFPRKRCRALLLAAVCLFFTAVGLADPQPEPLILGVHPYLSYPEIQARFRPLARHLARHLGQTVDVRVGSTYDKHVDQIGQDGIDIAYMGPVSYVKLINRYGTKPLLAQLERNGQSMLDGHIVVARNSAMRTLDDLRGHSFGLGDPNSTMSSVIPLVLLERAGISFNDLSDHKRFRGHSNIALAVLSGRIEAGAVKSEVYERFADQGLRSLQRLPSVPEHLFVARSDMQNDLLNNIRALLQSLHITAEGRSVLRALHRDATALRAVSDGDYDSLRTLLGE